MLVFWSPRRMCVFGVCAVYIDTSVYDGRHPHKILSHHKRHKKGKYIESCIERQCHLKLFVLSAERVIGEETK